MNLTIRASILFTVASGLALMLAATPGAAREPRPLDTCLSDTEQTDEARAAALHAEAMYVLRSQAGWEGVAKKVSRLLETSAKLRSPCHPESYRSLHLAAGLHDHLGDVGRARTLMLAAAERALYAGDVSLAADAFVSAAQLALREGDRPAALQAIRKAELLSGSPLLSAADRRLIRARLGQGVELAGQDTRAERR